MITLVFAMCLSYKHNMTAKKKLKTKKANIDFGFTHPYASRSKGKDERKVLENIAQSAVNILKRDPNLVDYHTFEDFLVLSNMKKPQGWCKWTDGVKPTMSGGALAILSSCINENLKQTLFELAVRVSESMGLPLETSLFHLKVLRDNDYLFYWVGTEDGAYELHKWHCAKN